MTVEGCGFNRRTQHFIFPQKKMAREQWLTGHGSITQKADIWDRWQRGESLNSNGRLFDRPSSSIFNMLAPTAGIRPPSRPWSPHQIVGWLKREYPEDESHQVSHETIYRSLFIQARGVLKKELQQHLRSQRAIRHSRHAM